MRALLGAMRGTALALFASPVFVAACSRSGTADDGAKACEAASQRELLAVSRVREAESAHFGATATESERTTELNQSRDTLAAARARLEKAREANQEKALPVLEELARRAEAQVVERTRAHEEAARAIPPARAHLEQAQRKRAEAEAARAAACQTTR